VASSAPGICRINIGVAWRIAGDYRRESPPVAANGRATRRISLGLVNRCGMLPGGGGGIAYLRSHIVPAAQAIGVAYISVRSGGIAVVAYGV